MTREVFDMREIIRATGERNIERESLKRDLLTALFTVFSVGLVLVLLVLASQI